VAKIYSWFQTFDVFWRSSEVSSYFHASGLPRNFVRGCPTNSVEYRGQRERGSGGGSPLVRGSTQFANEWNPILIRLLRIYFPRNWEFGSALSKLWNLGGIWTTQTPPPPSVHHCSSPMKMEQAECSETLAFKLHMPVNHPEESIWQKNNLL
jgi:hypothetical protein